MAWFITALMTGITAFVATNIDDILILMVFFSQVNDQFRPRQIIIGQYLGFAVLLLLSSPGFLGGLILPRSWIGLLGLLPIAIGLKQLWKKEEEADIQTISTPINVPWIGGFSTLLHPKVYQVMAVTFANGGDNIGIYVPLFGGSDLRSLLVILGVFLVLVGVWCAIAAYLAKHRAIAPLLICYSHWLVPFVLIGLGFYILIENGSYRLLPPFAHS